MSSASRAGQFGNIDGFSGAGEGEVFMLVKGKPSLPFSMPSGKPVMVLLPTESPAASSQARNNKLSR